MRLEAVLALLVKRSRDRLNPTNPSSQEFRGVAEPHAGHCVLARELESRVYVL